MSNDALKFKKQILRENLKRLYYLYFIISAVLVVYFGLTWLELRRFSPNAITIALVVFLLGLLVRSVRKKCKHYKVNKALFLLLFMLHSLTPILAAIYFSADITVGVLIIMVILMTSMLYLLTKIEFIAFGIASFFVSLYVILEMIPLSISVYRFGMLIVISLFAGFIFSVRSFGYRQKIFESQTKLKEQKDKFEYLSKRDLMTGFYNNNTLYALLEDLLKEDQYRENIYVAMIDIDYFKKVNDSKGHLFGDQVIIKLSQVMKEMLKEDDIIGRYGGEEFAVVMIRDSYKQACEEMNDLRLSVGAVMFDVDFRVTISVGVSEYNGGKVAELLSDADRNLYIAKHSGRNCVKCNQDFL